MKKFISSKNPIIPTGPRRDLAAMACPLCSEAFFAQFVEGVLATRQYNGHHGCKDEGTLPSEARMRVQYTSKTDPTIETCLRRRRKPGAKCALGGRAHEHRGRPCLHRGREWSAWLERACPYCLSTASPRPQTPGRRRSRGSLSAAQMAILPHVRPKKK